MTETKRKLLPDYQMVDGFKVAAAFSPQAFRETVNLKPRATDVILSTFPKCGTTWTQQIIHLIRNGGKTGGDSFQTCPFLEFTGTEVLDHMPDPRDMKIHLPFNLTPYSSDTKYVVVFRNPKDALVSFYHHTASIVYGFAGGDFNDYFEIFINGENDFGDYFDHVLSWYEHRNDPNVLHLYFEAMKKDHRGAVIQIATFLGPEYEEMIKDPKVLDDIVKYSSFEFMKKEVNFGPKDVFDMKGKDIDSMPYPMGMKHILKYLSKNRENHNNDLHLVRKGIVGDWRNNFSEDQNRRMNEKIERKLRGTGLLEYWNSIGCL